MIMINLRAFGAVIFFISTMLTGRAHGQVLDEARAAFESTRTVLQSLQRNGASETNLSKDQAASTITKLHELHAAINKQNALDGKMGKLDGVLAPEIRRRVNEYRAVSLWHAWAAISCAATSNIGDTPEFLQITLGGPERPLVHSLLQLALHLKSDDHPEPLVCNLDESPWLVLDLEGSLRFKPKAAYSSKSTNFAWIPTLADLIGKPDQPTKPVNAMLPLWGLINRIVDRHQSNLLDPEGKIASNRCVERPIADALDSLCTKSALGSLAPNTNRRVQRLTAFLRFRENASAPQRLVAIVDELRMIRRTRLRQLESASTPQPGDPPPGVRVFQEMMRDLAERRKSTAQAAAGAVYDLIIAALPVPFDPTDTCLQATVWLRYVILQTFTAGDRPTNETTGLNAAWSFLVPGATSAGGNRGKCPDPDEIAFPRFDRRSAPDQFLRFGQLPAENSLADLLDKIADQTIALARVQEEVRAIGHLLLDDPVTNRHPRQEQLSAAILRALDAARKAQDAGIRPGHRGIIGSARALGISATATEQDRVLTHAVALAGLAQSLVQDLRKLNQSPERLPASALATLGDVDIAWRQFDPPARTLQAYKEDLDLALKSYCKSQAEFEAERAREAVLQDYENAVASYESSLLEQQAVVLGEKVAKLVVERSQRLREIVALENSAAHLLVRIRELENQGRAGEVRAADHAVALRARARDLAQVQVEALEELHLTYKNQVTGAIHQFNQRADELMRLADHIEDQKRKSSFVKMIKSIVSVLGVVLTPFTGGQSLVVAQAVNQTITTIDTVAKLDWSSLGDTVEGIVQIGGGFSDFSKELGMDLPENLTLKNFKNLKKGLKSVREWAHTSNRDLKVWSDSATALVRNIKEENTDPRRLLALVAADVPLRLEGEKLVADVGDSAHQLKDDLETAARSLIEVGGVLKNNVAERAHALGQTQVMEEPEQFLKNALVQLPKQALQELGIDTNEANIRFEIAKKQLIEQIKSSSKPVRTRIAQSLTAGAVLLDHKQKILLVDRDVIKEVNAMLPKIAASGMLLCDNAIRQVQLPPREEAEKWLDRLEDLDTLTADTLSECLDGLNLKPEQAMSVLSLLKADVPLRTISGRITADLPNSALELEGDLKDAIGDLIRIGGVLNNNPSERARALRQKQIDPEEYLNEDYLKKALVQLPQEALKALGIPARKSDFIDARSRLLEQLERSSKPIRERFAQALAVGSVLLQDTNGMTLLVNCKLSQEIKYLQKTLESVKKTTQDQELKALHSSIRKAQLRIDDLANRAGRSEKDLRRIADGPIKNEVDGLREILKEYKETLNRRMEDLWGAEKEFSISTYSRAARQAYLKASKLGIEAAAKSEEAKQLHLLNAELEGRVSDLGLRQQQDLVEARRLELNAQRRAIDRAASRCLALGVRSRLLSTHSSDPAWTKLSPLRVLAPMLGYGHTAALRKAVDAAGGIARWAALVDPSEAKKLGHLVLDSRLQTMVGNTHGEAIAKLHELADQATNIVQSAIDEDRLRPDIAHFEFSCSDIAVFRTTIEETRDGDGEEYFVGHIALPLVAVKGKAEELTVFGGLPVNTTPNDYHVFRLLSQETKGRCYVYPDLAKAVFDDDFRIANLGMTWKLYEPYLAAEGSDTTRLLSKSLSLAGKHRKRPVLDKYVRDAFTEIHREFPQRRKQRIVPGCGTWICEFRGHVGSLANLVGKPGAEFDEVIEEFIQGVRIHILVPIQVISP